MSECVCVCVCVLIFFCFVFLLFFFVFWGGFFWGVALFSYCFFFFSVCV